jgi:radical SAM superfamily enzyme YgiQ (UPF0313 family)
LPFTYQARPNLITEEIVRDLKNAGAVTALMAIESGNDHLRNDILKRGISKEQLLKASKLMRKYNIKFITQNILGLPEETWETAMETLDLNIRCKPTYAYATLFQPFPKTELGEYAIKIGLFDGDYTKFTSHPYREDLYTNIHPYLKKELINLQKLFAMTINFPFLRRYVHFLVKASKNNMIYKLIYFMHKKIVYKFIVRIY